MLHIYDISRLRVNFIHLFYFLYLSPSTFLWTVTANIRSLCSSLILKDQVLETFKTTGKLNVFPITFVFSDAKKKTKDSGLKVACCYTAEYIQSQFQVSTKRPVSKEVCRLLLNQRLTAINSDVLCNIHTMLTLLQHNASHVTAVNRLSARKFQNISSVVLDLLFNTFAATLHN